MTTKHIEYGQSVDVILGPSERSRNELRTAVIDLGAVYLLFAERLTLIGGRRP